MENNNCMLYSPKEDNNTVQDCTTCERSRDCYPDYYPDYYEQGTQSIPIDPFVEALIEHFEKSTT